METPAQRRWRELPADAPRDEFFAALRGAITEYYLADPDDPYRRSLGYGVAGSLRTPIEAAWSDAPLAIQPRRR